MPEVRRADVAIVGTGNAAMAAAHAARDAGARVLVIEKAPRHWAGGNTWFTAGAMRTSHQGLEDLEELIELADRGPRNVVVEPYSPDAYLADIDRVTGGHFDRNLAGVLVRDSRETMTWLRSLGIAFRLMPNRQAYEVDGRQTFWGGLAVGVEGEGKAMVDVYLDQARERGIEVVYERALTGLAKDDDGRVTRLRTRSPNGVASQIEAGCVVLACGGFEADRAKRRAHLGEVWENVPVRGTPYNTGDGIDAALDIGAEAHGDWSTCHAVAWEAAAGPTGDRELTHRLTRGSYPLGIVVNVLGERFLDEGADFRNYTYARYGAEIVAQPSRTAFQIFDEKVASLLRSEEYRGPSVSVITADTVESLAAQLAESHGVESGRLCQTIEDFNRAVVSGTFNPSVKDGCRTRGLDPDKTNWAQRIDQPPFTAFPVTCAITFTFGGIGIDECGRVLNSNRQTIPGLYAAGEIVGGLFSSNYPGGSGLMAGAVFGRRAGTAAALDILSARAT